MKSVSSRVSLAFMPAVGSSSRSSLGLVARARAISSRRWSPYGRLRAQACGRAPRPTKSSSSWPRSIEASSSALLRGVRMTASHQRLRRWGCWPTRTLSRADIVPNSRMFWNVRPMPSAVT